MGTIDSHERKQREQKLREKFLSLFRTMTEEHRNDVFWLLLLVGLLPALRADLLFPPSWLSGLASQYPFPEVDNPFGVLATVIGAIILGVSFASKRRRRGLVAIPIFALLIADSFIGRTLTGFNTIYVVSAFITFVYFVFRGEALSLPFAVFLVFLVIGQAFDDLLAWPQILIFLGSVLVGRLVIEAVIQNLPLAKELGRSNLLALTGCTFSLWWPMLILIALGMWGSNQILDATQNLMYKRGYVVPFCAVDSDDPLSILPCPDGKPVLLVEHFNREGPHEMWSEGDPLMCHLLETSPVQRFVCPPDDDSDSWPLEQQGFFDSLDLTVQRDFKILRRDIESQLDSIDVAALQSKKTARTEARRVFSIVPESTGMKTSSCTDFPYVDCEAANIVIKGLNRAYKNKRDEAEGQFVDYIIDRAEGLKSKTTEFTTDIRETLTEDLNNAEARTRQSIDRVHTAGNVVRQILLLWLIVVTIKSMLYVFARVIFDKSTDINIDLLEREGKPTEGSVTTVQEVNIAGKYPHDIYYKANYQPLGPAARFSIPQWRASLMSRLRFGSWHMSRVVMPLVDDDGVTFNSVEAEHLVDWDLKGGEEVIFSYRNFVAMNENVQLRTVISLRVATLLLGRIVFHTARCTGGSGRLILRTRGKPATADRVQRSIPAARLVAWNRYARFSVDSHLTLADIFLNGFNLRRSASESERGPQGILIVEADARDGGLLVGTLRFAKNFLMPI